MSAPNSGDPNLLLIPGGAAFFTAPDNTLAPTVGNPLTNQAGVPVDLTGMPLTAAPNRSGNQAVVTSANNPNPNSITVDGLYNVSPADVGSVLALGNTQASGTLGVPPPNSGIYQIVEVFSSSAVRAAKFVPVPPNPIFPDLASGQITWVVFKQNEFAQGDPLSYVAALGLPLNIVTPAPGPARFGDYDAAMQPVVVNDEGGLFAKVQRM